ncbi:MAG: hypothetical protein MI757_01530, partial [Pirellulales bacterium]|nr:hypothetical protein [Pirellulales bacterium]
MSRWKKHERVSELAAAMCRGVATDEEIRELDAILASDDAACEFYVDFLGLEAELTWSLAAEERGESLHEQLQAPADTSEIGGQSEADDAVKCVHTEPAHRSPLTPHPSHSSRRNLGYGMIAGVIFLAGLFTWAATTYLPGIAKH